ncbi:hypothetical protein SAV14893_093370 [Streptomyces avermitilis]|uniref:Uncharacterized protein n=1 Tax=Streptomyces avermitilis TaxID=33903 RepID=A0A4D4MDP9_STRAX|nr:hypothetical protein SAVMC3_03050 [Streptomyces avermitilis]GDY69944.1 hypothetical protein SAV14893_093370 [Streptomyces avermitilis]
MAAHVVRGAGDVGASDLGVAGGGAQGGAQHPDGGRLAGAIGAEEGKEFALGDGEVQALDGFDISVGAAQARVTIVPGGEVGSAGVIGGPGRTSPGGSR